MKKARYVIVRVDDSLFCPDRYEKISNKSVCEFVKEKEYEGCDGCRYGDTKEQLIRKIAQALVMVDINKGKSFEETNNAVAKFIVEFLGVKE